MAFSASHMELGRVAEKSAKTAWIVHRKDGMQERNTERTGAISVEENRALGAA